VHRLLAGIELRRGRRTGGPRASGAFAGGTSVTATTDATGTATAPPFTGNAIAHKANVTTSKSYNTLSDFRFDFKTFTELKNAQSVTLAYDGFNPLPPTFMYLKPYFNDVNKSYFRQLADGEL